MPSGTPHGIRLATYRAVMKEAGLGKRIRVVKAAPGQDAAYHATGRCSKGVIDRPRVRRAREPALGVLRAMAEAGSAPDDVSVVGYDDTDMPAIRGCHSPA